MKTPKKQTEITEAQVVSFLQVKRAELCAATGREKGVIDAQMDINTGAIRWSSYVPCGSFLTRNTPDEAIAAQVEAISAPGIIARAKAARDEAARLLAEADRLEKEAAK